MIDKVFFQILNMSFASSFAIIFVLFARLILKKVPKVFSYTLWSVVLFGYAYHGGAGGKPFYAHCRCIRGCC